MLERTRFNIHAAEPAPAIAGILSPHVSRRPYVAAGLIAGLIILGTIFLLPYGAYRGPPLSAMVSMYAVNMSLIEALTAYFLTIQFRSTRSVLLGGVAGAFGFVSVVVLSQILVFPGVFGPAGLFAASPQSSIWMWVIWHAGFPIFVLAALLVDSGNANARRRRLIIGWAFIIAGPSLAVLCSYIAIAHGGVLPVLITKGSYIALRRSPSMGIIIGATGISMLLCVWRTGLRNLLSLWLEVALLASLADSALTLSGCTRYDVGWYSGRLLNILSSSIVFCVLIGEISRLYGRLLAANAALAARAVRDGLTGAFNRGYFDEQFAREVKRAAREQTPLSLLLADVDHFKLYNDILGHQRGDDCLVAIVKALQAITKRPGDFVGRYGGEEFAIVLPNTDSAGALNIAHEVRAGVACLRLPHGEGGQGYVTVSLGVATLNPREEALSPAELLHRADEALYRAKQAGRDTARAFAPFPARAAAMGLPA